MSQVVTETESGLWQPEWESMDVAKFSDSFYDMDQEPLSEPIRLLKLKAILRARVHTDYNTLIRYMRTTEGLVTNDQRVHIWPALLCRDCGSEKELSRGSSETASPKLSQEYLDVTLNDINPIESNREAEAAIIVDHSEESAIFRGSFSRHDPESFSEVCNTQPVGIISDEPPSDHGSSYHRSENFQTSTESEELRESLNLLELSNTQAQHWDLFGTNTTCAPEDSPNPPSTPKLAKKLSSLLSQQTVTDSIEPTGTRRSDRLSSSYARLLLDELSAADLPPHRDEEQVKLDINRSSTILSHLQTPAAVNESFTEILSDADIDVAKKKLHSLIVKVLRKHPSLNYYQGFHDVASVVLVVCHGSRTLGPWGGPLDLAGDELAFKILESLALYHLRDFMTTDISLTANHLLMIPCILEVADPEFFLLIKSACTLEGFEYDYKFYQAISSILTLFSHDMANFNDTLVVWDFFLSYNSVFANIYVYVALLLFYKPRIYSSMLMDINENSTSINNSDPVFGSNTSKKTKTRRSTHKKQRKHDSEASEKPFDKDALHSLLSPTSLFQNLAPGDLVKILNIAGKLIQQHPVNSLSNVETTFDVWFGRFNRHSVLMTTSVLSNSYQVTTSRNKKYNFLFERDALRDWMATQDAEIGAQDLYYADLMIQLMSRILNASTSSSDKSGSLLLASSISSLSSSTAALNSKFATTSQILSRMFFTDDVENDEKEHPEKRVSKRVLNFYKISLTIGFFGVLIHFLISRNNYRWNDLRLNEQLNKQLGKFSSQILTILWKIAKLIGQFVDDTLVEHIGYKSNGYLGQVGLGNVRNSIYRMG